MSNHVMHLPDLTAARGIRGERVLLLGILLGAALLRLLVLEARGLWFDEAFSVALARSSVGQIWRLTAQTDAHPPLYYLLLHAWLALGDSQAVVRSLSVICGVLTVLVTWKWARDVGGPLLAAAAGVLLAGSTLAVQASVEARMYPLLALLAVSSSYALTRAATPAAGGGAHPGRWAVYGGLVALGLYVHYFTFLLLPAHLVFVLLHRRIPGVRRGFVLALAGAFVAYLPWWPALTQQLAAGRAAAVWNDAMPWSAPLNIVGLSSFGGYLLDLGGYLLDINRWSWWQLLLVGPFLALIIAGAVVLPRRGDALLLAIGWAGPIVVLVGASLATGVFYAVPRHLSFVQPFFAVLLAQGVLTVVGRQRKAMASLILVAGITALNLAILGATSRDPRYQPYNWVSAARHVEAHWQPGDGLLFYPHTARIAFSYYYRPASGSAVTLYPPSPTAPRTRADLVRALPDLPGLFPSARRVWVVLTEPVTLESREALLEALARSYHRREGRDFRQVYVLLYERP